MRKTMVSCLLTVFCLTGIWGTTSANAAKSKQAVGSGTVLSASEFRATIKRLWLEQLGYTRQLVISTLAELPDLEKLKARLAKNQEDLAEEFKAFYGEEGSEKWTALLKKHAALTEEIIKTLAKGTQEQFLEVNAQWEASAEEMAEFIRGRCPKLLKEDLNNLFFKQMNAVSGQVNARLKKDWDSDFAYYDKALAGILTLADTMAEGVIAQFPKRFKR